MTAAVCVDFIVSIQFSLYTVMEERGRNTCLGSNSELANLLVPPHDDRLRFNQASQRGMDGLAGKGKELIIHAKAFPYRSKRNRDGKREPYIYIYIYLLMGGPG